MNLIKFIQSFPDETSCRIRFKEFRDAHGVICRRCGSTDHYWLKTIEKYQCKKCKTRTSLRSGTVMQESNLPFRHWFIAIHLLTGTKKSFSALELQRQIGHKYYEPIWYMLQKLRRTMGSRDSRYQLDKIVELDERFFETVDTEKDEDEKSAHKKRGRGSAVIVMASTVHNFGKIRKNSKPSMFRFVKMLVVDNLRGQAVGEKVSEKIKYDSVVTTANYRSYSKIKENIRCQIPQTVKPKDAKKVLPWVHIMMTNARRTLLGVHHMISTKYAQNYLDEFCYKVNRRNYGEQLFDRLLIACVSASNKSNMTHCRQS
jgi:hypothetical protein